MRDAGCTHSTAYVHGHLVLSASAYIGYICCRIALAHCVGCGRGNDLGLLHAALCCRRGKHLESHASGAAAEWRERFFNFYDERLMGGKWGGEANKETIEMFLRLLAVCHTVVPEGPPDEHKVGARACVRGVHWFIGVATRDFGTKWSKA